MDQLDCKYRTRTPYRLISFGMGALALAVISVFLIFYRPVSEFEKVKAAFSESLLHGFFDVAGLILICGVLIVIIYVAVKDGLGGSTVTGVLLDLSVPPSATPAAWIKLNIGGKLVKVRYDDNLLACFRTLINQRLTMTIGTLGVVLTVRHED